MAVDNSQGEKDASNQPLPDHSEDGQSSANTEVAETKAEPNTGSASKAEPEPAADSEPAGASGPEADSESTGVSGPKAESNSQAKSWSEASAKSGSDGKPEPGPESEPDGKPRSESGPKPESGTQSPIDDHQASSAEQASSDSDSQASSDDQTASDSQASSDDQATVSGEIPEQKPSEPEPKSEQESEPETKAASEPKTAPGFAGTEGDQNESADNSSGQYGDAQYDGTHYNGNHYSRDYYASHLKPWPKQKTSPNKLVIVLVALVVVLIIVLTVLLVSCQTTAPTGPSPEQEAASSETEAATSEVEETPAALSSPSELTLAIQSSVNELVSPYGEAVSVTHLDADTPADGYAINGDTSRQSASMIKLLVLADLLEQVHDGILSLDTTVTLTAENSVGGSGVIAGNIGVEYSLKDLAYYMIAESDNSACNVLIDLLGMDNINAEAEKLGLTNTSLQRKMMDTDAQERGLDNYTSSNDIATILQLIATGQLVDQESSDFAYACLQAQEIDAGLASGTGSGAEVAHKTGSLTNAEHDGGIVTVVDGTSAGEKYVLVVMTQGLSQAEADQLIANIASVTYSLVDNAAAGNAAAAEDAAANPDTAGAAEADETDGAGDTPKTAAGTTVMIMQ